MRPLSLPDTGANLGVLVVDDDSHLLRTLSDILRRRGFEPQVATTGHQGLSLLSGNAQGAAIALVDLALPDMDGLELVNRLRRVSQLTEVVILTGNASLDSALGALREQSYDYLIKPVRPDHLIETVRRAGERWRRRRAEEALQESEQRLRILVENISDVVLMLDVESRIAFTSAAIRASLGYRPEDLLGASLATIVHRDDVLLLERSLSSDVEDHPEVRLRRSDGSWGLFSCRTREVREAPSLAGHVFIAQDVTDKRRLEAQALQAQKLDSIGRLAGGVAHDFNNLLTVILGYCELALHLAVGQPKMRRLLELVREAGERGATLTQQLLAFARKQSSAPRLVDPNQLIHDLESLLRRTLPEDIELTTDLDRGLGFVRIDPAQMEQILMNLVVNARDAMPDGGTLRIFSRRVECPKAFDLTANRRTACFLMRVQDTGIGIEPEVEDRLFEPFFTTKEQGTGLGLATTYGIVRQAGGQILVESEVGQGTTVEIYLPVLDQRDAEPEAEIGPQSHPRGNERVLVVEDQDMVRQVVCDALASLGYTVQSVSSGREALALLESAHPLPDLVLTDVVMPGLSGEELLECLRDRFPALPVLLMSGHPSDRHEASGERPPILPKPVSVGALARAIRSGLDKPVSPPIPRSATTDRS